MRYDWAADERARAERHQANGDAYMREGKPDFAAGSYRKAERNRKRAADIDALRIFTSGGVDLSVVDALAAAMSKKIYGV